MNTASKRGAASSYRLQLSPAFDFTAAADAVPYLAQLGVTHAYLSPVFQATQGSTHGYDVTDPTRLRDEFGGRAAFDTLLAAADAHGLRLLLDIVPNHMAATDENPWWRDVLAHGRSSEHAYLFDVDWDVADGRVRRGPPRSEINYRRFFEIDDLVAVRQEDPRTFATTHTLVAELAAHRVVDGLRVDHLDGLRYPQGYLDQLRAAAPDAWVLVEKILEPGEVLPSWPIAGTTGYEFGSRVLGVFVDPTAAGPLSTLYADLTGDRRSWADAVRAGKRHALAAGLANDVARVARAFGDPAFGAAITEMAVEWPVYRTYTRPGVASAADAALIARVANAVRERVPEQAAAVDRIAAALLRRSGDDDAADLFQLLTGPAMAKGVEDRAFYDFTRFVALNEVGGNPDAFGVSVEEWHAACARVARETPETMLATSTHDTKRGEDVRARLAVLTERVDWWSEVASKWMARHTGIDAPTAYLLLQTVVGAWPVSQERLGTYMQKAAREAGAHTSWADPDAGYEKALAAEVEATLEESSRIDAIVGEISQAGDANALAQTLLRLTAPGVPDTYQGTELGDFSLVDPDNRRPVDYALRRSALAQLDADPGAHPKLLVVARALAARPRMSAEYEPLETDDPSLLAFQRGNVAVVIPTRSGAQGSVNVAAGSWTNTLTGEQLSGGAVRASDLFARFPVALLCR